MASRRAAVHTATATEPHRGRKPCRLARGSLSHSGSYFLLRRGLCVHAGVEGIAKEERRQDGEVGYERRFGEMKGRKMRRERSWELKQQDFVCIHLEVWVPISSKPDCCMNHIFYRTDSQPVAEAVFENFTFSFF